MNELWNFIRKTWIVLEFEVRKIIHEPTEIFVRLVQPILWLVIFGSMFNRYSALRTGNVSYMAFITPGILAQSVLFVSIFFGISITWDRESGLLAKLMVTPTPRGAIILGKALSAGVRGLVQTVVILIVGVILGIHFVMNPLNFLGVAFVIVLAAVCFSCLSILLASFLKHRERFMGVIQLVTMPLFFASNALYPVEAMPTVLKYVTVINPLYYVVDALRGMLITDDLSMVPVDIAVLLGVTTLFVMAGTWALKRLMR
jgi:ABC-2 type transport system permease protein